MINRNLDLIAHVTAYEAGGAAAVSILTEPARFGGSNDDLSRARAALGIPILKKDFHVDPIQILEARSLGASAALVIARAVPPSRLQELISVGRDTGIEVLIEVRDERELELALGLGALLIGVNNRNLETLEIDPEIALRLIPLIPADAIAIAESGVKSVADVESVARAGADAVLVGTELSRSRDPEASVRSLTGIPRTTRARKS